MKEYANLRHVEPSVLFWFSVSNAALGIAIFNLLMWVMS